MISRYERETLLKLCFEKRTPGHSIHNCKMGYFKGSLHSLALTCTVHIINWTLLPLMTHITRRAATHLHCAVYCTREYPALSDCQCGHATLMTEKGLNTSETLQVPNLQRKEGLEAELLSVSSSISFKISNIIQLRHHSHKTGKMIWFHQRSW